jgi:hypothetical protein|tara:strand:- start:1069 stop:1278 length:210 start_codon:yes stop_codon:yes gene_type:complete
MDCINTTAKDWLSLNQYKEQKATNHHPQTRRLLEHLPQESASLIVIPGLMDDRHEEPAVSFDGHKPKTR